jgi:dTDP-4-dehydrorhamnose 3,5-epimerase
MPSKPFDLMLRADLEKKRSVQSYDAKPKIDGVQLIDLRRFVEESGDFQELARITADGTLQGLGGFHVRQVNHSMMHPGSVKAWHLHSKQDDVWFVPPQGELLIGLLDARKDSKTSGARMRLVLGAGRSQLLFIPRGVAHGAANLSSRDAAIVYFVNQQFDAKDPDEHRLPWDVAGADFWTAPKG